MAHSTRWRRSARRLPSLPPRLGFVRRAVLEPIETYVRTIPDSALLKYDEAEASRLFSKFWVATPAYFREQPLDPWIIGEIEGRDLYAVIAQWDAADVPGTA